MTNTKSGPFYRPDGDEYLVERDGSVRLTGYNAHTNPRPVRKAPTGRRGYAGQSGNFKS